MTPAELARKFHDTYERLAPSFGYETRLDTKMFDPESKNGKLMIAVCAEVCGDLRAERDAAVELLKKIMEDRAEATWCFGTDLTDQIDAALAAQELKT